MKVLIIDNYDSFTYNLFQDLGGLLEARRDGSEVKVIRNNAWTLEQVKAWGPDRILLSPGPGNPADPAYFGVCAEILLHLDQPIPILGVCLGMQGICHYFGGRVMHAQVPMHGKVSPVRHDSRGAYAGLPQDVEVMRYHSLVADPLALPECLEVTSVIAPSEGGSESLGELLAAGAEIMGVRHRTLPIEGIQFHPESFGTEGGRQMLRNFLEQA